MAKKKATKPEVVDEQKALEARVDALMDPRPDAKQPVAEKVSVDEIKEQFQKNMDLPPEEAAPEPVKVIQATPHETAKTAPELPGAKKSAAKEEVPEEVTEATEEPEAAEQPTEQPTADTAEADLEPEVDIDDQQTDEAVDDIVVKEADTVLAVEDARRAHKEREGEAAPKRSGFMATFWLALEIVLILAIGASVAALIIYGV